MSIHWIDVSMPLRPGMAFWPGDEPFDLRPNTRIASGARHNQSSFSMSCHGGTHIDAPWHFEEDGKHVDELDSNVFFGEALLLDLSDIDSIKADHLGNVALPERVLFKTRNSDIRLDQPFVKDYVAVEADAAEHLVNAGVKLVGIDYLSVAPYKQPEQTTHHRLLRNNIVVVEGLRLGEFTTGMYRFTVLPLLIDGADGAPCRAFIGREEGDE